MLFRSGEGYFVFGGGKLFLQGEEVLGRLEFRVTLDVDHESAQRAGKGGFGLAGFGGAVGIHGGGAGFGDGLERAAFVGHVALDGFDEVGNQVVAALELHVDLRPGVVDEVAQVDETVVDGDEPEDEGDENTKENENGGHGGFPFVCWARAGARIDPPPRIRPQRKNASGERVKRNFAAPRGWRATRQRREGDANEKWAISKGITGKFGLARVLCEVCGGHCGDGFGRPRGHFGLCDGQKMRGAKKNTVQNGQ